MEKNTASIYNRSPIWRIGLFSLNNTATNIFHFTTFYVSFYAVGAVGLATALVGNLLMAMRLFDGFTDPVVGFIMDKTDSKLGKFRPFLFIGFIIMSVANLIMYNVTHTLPENTRLIFFILIYAVYIIGYTCSTAVTKAAQNVMTNDPKQRPLFGAFDGTYSLVLFNTVPIYVAMYLLPKYNNKWPVELFQEFILTAILISGILTVLVIIGLWEKDRTEFFGLGGERNVPLKFKDYFDVIKNNRAIQMLIVAASTDKLAMTISGNSVVAVMLYGIIIGDNTQQGAVAGITIIPSFLFMLLFVQYARNKGIKKGMQITAFLSMLFYGAMFAIIKFGTPTLIRVTEIDFANISASLMTFLFIGAYAIARGVSGASGALTINAISDVADYETYRTGRYVPGMMGTLFSFVDKFISSFATVVVMSSVAAIGYTNTLPQIGEKLTPEIMAVTMGLFIGLPVMGWIASLISLRFYPLDSEKMLKIQSELQARRLAE